MSVGIGGGVSVGDRRVEVPSESTRRIQITFGSRFRLEDRREVEDEGEREGER